MTILRVTIVVIIVATVLLRLSSRETYVETLDYDARTAITKAVSEAGAEVFDNPHDPRRLSGHMVYFRETGCDKRSVAFAFGIGNDSRAMTQRIEGPTWAAQIIYFDQILQRQDRTILISTWLRERALAVLGLSQSVPAAKAVYYSVPPQCAETSRINWQTVWQREVAP